MCPFDSTDSSRQGTTPINGSPPAYEHDYDSQNPDGTPNNLDNHIGDQDGDDQNDCADRWFY